MKVQVGLHANENIYTVIYISLAHYWGFHFSLVTLILRPSLTAFVGVCQAFIYKMLLVGVEKWPYPQISRSTLIFYAN